MDRRGQLLDGCPVTTGLGLEFGPLANPVVRKDQGRVIYVDCHCTVWTSSHFGRVIPEVIRLRGLPLRIRRLDDPVPGTNEFLVQLECV